MNIGSSAAFPRRLRLAFAWLFAMCFCERLFILFNGSAGLFAECTRNLLTAKRLQALGHKSLLRMRCCASPCMFACRLFICHQLTLVSHAMITVNQFLYAAILAAVYMAYSPPCCNVCTHLAPR